MGTGWVRRAVWGLLGIGGGLALAFLAGAPPDAPGIPTWEARARVEAAEVGTYRILLPLVLRAPLSPPPEWLARLNAYRALAGLPPVMENPDWRVGCEQHARYMVKNDVITHWEDPNNPWYTPEGDACGRHANVMVSSSATTSDAYAIDVWMQAPFHAVAMLDPRLLQVGYGAYREAIGKWQMGAALDVLRGLEASARSFAYPVRWPGDGSVIGLRAFQVGEYPDPLAHCNYTAPAGLPIIVLLGSGSLTPSVTNHQVWQDGTPVAHCAFDETTYTHPTDPDQQQLGRRILDSRDAVVILPKDPLASGARYTVSLTVNGQTYTWSFSVASSSAQATIPSGQETEVR